MKTYLVGGFVRDTLLGLQPSDRDYVVVGATPAEMRALGYKTVGADFPVFLHPDTGDEYALARTERKSAPGYKGFTVVVDQAVTLEEDLHRRDLTVNAMALDTSGTLIDPCGGKADLDARVFRHVSTAFTEDPVRVLRIARFAAKYPDFSIAPETEALLVKMVQSGELDALVPERVLQELNRGMATSRPDRMWSVLKAIGAVDRLWPELHVPDTVLSRLPLAVQQGIPTEHLLAWIASYAERPEVWMMAVRGTSESITLAKRLQKVSEDWASRVTATPEALLDALEKNDAFRRPDLWEATVRLIQLRYPRTVGSVQTDRLRQGLAAAAAVNQGEVARSVAGLGGDAIRQAVRAARRNVLVLVCRTENGPLCQR